ncbi:TonB-dependent receptor [Solitalea sp. MAHUQ-68]|uniref:TonB-dependent receptor n=1 Tax=Solitalea agri TaxID=2953739 RepID=A0A9X2F0D9_9SPHI|nr:TonB-dependent receptor [Solitalea agri]MCO4291810.1 TonB-dependent receptor [Solitalea agri]
MRKHVLVFLALLLLCTTHLLAQELVVKGKVIDSQSLPLTGVTISVKGSSKGTSTDADGNYSISAPSNGTLVFNFIGYKPVERAIAGKTSISVQLQEDVSSLEEVVVVGYGTQKKGLVTGAISQVKAEDLKTTSISRIDQALQGRTAGVTVLPQSGSPGSPVSIRIRGAGSNASSQPLYIIDGMRAGGIEYLDPSEIESTEILKDAASAAIYGAEGANGVVIITTKSGSKKKESSKIDYSFQYGVQSIGNIMPMMNPQQYAQYLTEANYAGTKPTTDEVAAAGNGTDWKDALFQTAPQQRHALTFSGGSEKSSYLVGMSYFNQQGVAGGDKSDFKRYTVRLNSDHKVKDWLNVGERLSYSNFATTGFAENSEFRSVVSSAIALDPLTPIVYPSGSALPTHVTKALTDGMPLATDANGNYYGISKYVLGEYGNPLGQVDLVHQSTQQNKVVGNVYADFDIVKGLKFTSRFGIDAAFVKNHQWTPLYWFSPDNQNSSLNGSDYQNNYFNWQWENFANYQKSFGSHSITAMAGMSAYKSDFNNMSSSFDGFFRSGDKYAYADFSPDTKDRIAGQYYASTLASYFVRAGYDYKGKYLFNGSFRADGSSKMAPSHQWGYFPAVSGGWVVSSENFFPESVAKVMNYTKLRASWGQNGSLSNVGVGAWNAGISTAGIQYPNSDPADQKNITGAAPTNLPNENLTWETSEQLDFGGELGFLNNSLFLEVDWFKKTTKDLLTPGVVPHYVGNILPVVNGGDVENKGWEFGLTYKGNSSKEFKYSVSGNLSFLKNKVTYMNPFLNVINGAGVGTGYTATMFSLNRPLWYFNGYKTDGIFQNQAQINQYVADNQLTGYSPKPGDPVVLDVNKDNKISLADQTMIGDPNPAYTFGLTLNMSYKGFDFLCFLQGQGGNDVMMGFNRTDRPSANKPEFFFKDRWTGDGSTNSWFAANTASEYVYNSDLMVFKGDFMRIRQLQVGYTFPSKLMNTIKVKSLRVYCSADNFFTFTNYKGFDPEGGSNASAANSVGIDRGVYPTPRVFTGGLAVTF